MTKSIGMLVKDSQMVVPLKHISVNIELQGLMANVEINQQYSNLENTPIEVVYTFPLASEAVLLDLSINLDGKKLTGTIVPKQNAVASYEEAVGDGDTAVLLEQLEGGLYSLSLGNLLPGKNVSIGLKYSQLYHWQGDDLRFLLPTVIAPRYGISQLEAQQQPLTSHEVEHRYALNMRVVGLLADAVIDSPSHNIKQQLDDNALTIQFLKETSLLDRDLVINFKLHGGDKACAFYDIDGRGFSAIASFKPTVAKLNQFSAVPKGVKILIDCSGSMSGDSIVQAREAIQLALKELKPADAVSIIRFGSSVEPFTDGLVPATQTNIKRLWDSVNHINADLGGTEIFSALKFALNQTITQSDKLEIQSSDIFLITDGEVWDNNESDLIVKAARDTRQRIFTVGVGSSVSEDFVSQLAKNTLGAVELASPNEAMTDKIVRHFQRIFAPVLSNVRVKWPSDEHWSYHPQQVFIGDTYISYAHLKHAPSGPVVLSASWPDGTAFHQCIGVDYLNTLDVSSQNEKDLSVDNNGLQSSTARIVANRQKNLCDNPGDTIAIAVKYQLMDKHTSYVMVEENIDKPESLPELRQVKQMLAAGWSGTGMVDTGSMQVVMELGEAPLSAPVRSMDLSYQEIVSKKSQIPARQEAFARSADKGGIDCEFDEAYPSIPVSFVDNCAGNLLSDTQLKTLTIDQLITLGLPTDIALQIRPLLVSGIDENQLCLVFLEQLTRLVLSKIKDRHFLRCIIKNRLTPIDEDTSDALSVIIRSWHRF